MCKTTKDHQRDEKAKPIIHTKKDKEEYLKRLKKMALYDAKAYLDITSDNSGKKKIRLKDDKAIDWDIIESVEISDDKVKVKFPDRSKAMEKYGKALMDDSNEKKAKTKPSYHASFLGESDEN